VRLGSDANEWSISAARSSRTTRCLRVAVVAITVGCEGAKAFAHHRFALAATAEETSSKVPSLEVVFCDLG